MVVKKPQVESATSVRRGEEDGYILVAVVFMVALVLLSLAVAAPKIAASIERDKEMEAIHRGDQYKRAIKLYYKKFGSYPTSIDQLEKTNDIRFLRRRYKDPLTGKDDWKPILMGQAHVRPLGFFGQPLGTSSIAGASTVSNGSFTPNGTSGTAGASTMGQTGATGVAGGMVGGSGSAVGGGIYAPLETSDGTGNGSSGSGSGTSSGSGSDTSSGSSSSSGFGSSSSSGFGSGSGSAFGSSGGLSSGTSSTLGAGTSSGTGLGASTSTTLGGAPIVGVTLPTKKPSILQYKLKTHYNEWEFVYDPAEDQAMGGGSLIGGSSTTTGNSVNGPGSTTSGTSSTGTSSGSSSIGFGSSSGSSGSSTGFGSSSTGSSGSTTPPQ